MRLPGVRGAPVAARSSAFVQKLRGEDLFKLPGVAETLDWAQALMTLDTLELDPQTINDTLGTLLKYQDDIAKMQGTEAAKILAEVNMRLARRAAEVGPDRAAPKPDSHSAPARLARGAGVAAIPLPRAAFCVQAAVAPAGTR